MATGMRLWTVIAVGLMAILAVSLLPLDSNVRRAPGNPLWSETDRERHDILREVTELNVRLKRIRWVDSLEAEMAAARQDGERFAFGVPEELAGEGSAWARETLADAVDATARSDVYFGTFFVDLRQSSHADVDRPYRPEHRGSEWYAGRLGDGTPYCMQIVADDRLHPEHTFTRHVSRGPAAALGVCRLWLRYGEPGPEVRAWLADGGSFYAAYGFPEDGAGTMWGQNVNARNRVRFGNVMGGLFAMDATTQVRRCITGVEGACTAFLFDPDARAGEWRAGGAVGPEPAADVTPLVASDARNRPRRVYWFSGAEGLIVANLERDFGHDAFGAFWRSDRAPEEAFRAAFGTGADGWLRDYLRGLHGAPDRGPMPRAATLGLVAVVLLGSMGVVGWVSRRRTVG